MEAEEERGKEEQAAQYKLRISRRWYKNEVPRLPWRTLIRRGDRSLRREPRRRVKQLRSTKLKKTLNTVLTLQNADITTVRTHFSEFF